MRLNVNGETRDDLNAATVKELLEELEIPAGRVAVEVNLCVVKKSEYEKWILKEGDIVEVVNFVGGGSMYSDLFETRSTPGKMTSQNSRSGILSFVRGVSRDPRLPKLIIMPCPGNSFKSESSDHD